MESGDIENEVRNIAWGDFKGISEEVKEKYSLSSVDELAILSRYIPILNQSAKDYSGVYEGIKESLQNKGDAWVEEVDPDLRSLYKFGKTNSIIVYEGESGEDEVAREKFHKQLASYTEKINVDLDIRFQLPGVEEGLNVTAIQKNLIIGKERSAYGEKN